MHYTLNSMIFQLILLLVTVVSQVNSFDITKNPFNAFKLSKEVLGSHSASYTHVAPPSTIIADWFVLLKDGDSDKTKISNDCPEDSTVCGVIQFHNENNSENRILQIFSVTETGVQYKSENDKPIVAYWNDVKYGDFTLDVNVNFLCSDSTDVAVNWINATTIIDSDITLNFSHKDFCSNKDGKKGGSDNDQDKKNNDSGLGFFGSTIIIMTVIFAGYIIAQAWFNTSTMGSSGDFLNELVDVIVESFSAIPRLLAEIVSKITGSSSASRGGYSAV